jgi:hypothetical protein
MIYKGANLLHSMPPSPKQAGRSRPYGHKSAPENCHTPLKSTTMGLVDKIKDQVSGSGTQGEHAAGKAGQTSGGAGGVTGGASSSSGQEDYVDKGKQSSFSPGEATSRLSGYSISLCSAGFRRAENWAHDGPKHEREDHGQRTEPV